MNGKQPGGYYCDDDYPEQDFDVVDEWEEAAANCCGNFGSDGVFRCGAAGSEDCDWDCPFSDDIGYTAEEIDAREAGEGEVDLAAPEPEPEAPPTPEELEAAGQQRLIP